MMRRYLILASMICLAGCGLSAKETTPPPMPPDKPATTTTTASTPPPEQKNDPNFNAKRVNQLKDLESRTFKVGNNTIKIWIMDDEGKREEGMMWLTEKEVKDNEGMLFVFGGEAKQAFWMQNTVLPLDITYISAKGKVVNTVQGKSFDETSLPSKGPAKYVLELKKGMAAKFGIKDGMILDLPKDVKAKDKLSEP